MAGALIVDVVRSFTSGARVAARFETAVEGGTIAVLFGPSGAGKTTVVRCIAGLERPDRGRIEFGGDVWFGTDYAPAQARRVGYVGQEPALFPHLSVRGNVEYGLAAAAPADRRQRADDMLARLGLTGLERRRPAELSGGEAQRVALARALAPRPRLLLLDEPFGAIDAPARAGLRTDLRALIRALAIPAVLVTHDRTEAIAMGDELIVLADGAVRQIGPVLDVFRRPADLVVARTVGVESVLPARVTRVDNGLAELAVGAATIRASDAELDPAHREVFACVRAEDVTLQRAAPAGASARNQFSGRIVSIDSEGPLERVTVDCGFPLVALITRSAREELALEEGATIVAAVKATAVHVVPRT